MGQSGSGAEPARLIDPARQPVLVIDNDPTAPLLYDNYLSSAGLQIFTARTCEQAREFLRFVTPAAIMLDVLVDTGAISPKDLDLIQFADTPEEAFALLRKGLTENYLAAELAAAGSHPASQQANHEEDMMAGWTVEDFLSPEMAKTSK